MLGVHCSWTCFVDVLFLVPSGKIGFPMCYLIKVWLSVKIGNDQKPRYSSCIIVMVMELHFFKILPSLLHGYHGILIPQFQNLTNFSPWNLFGLLIPPFIFLLFFLEINRNYIMLIMITIASNITVLVSQNIIFFAYEPWCQ